MRAIIEQLKYWHSLSDREDSKAKFAFWACSVMFAIVFFSFFVLAGRSPFSLLVPGLSFPWPGIDHRVQIEMYLPVQRSADFAPTPKLLDLEIPKDALYHQKLFNRLLNVLAEGRSLKQPGEEFHPSDDLILELLPRVQPRAVWSHQEKLFVDLPAETIRLYKPAELYRLFHSMHLTIEENAQLASLYDSLQITFGINGQPVKQALAGLTTQRQEKFLKALSWPPKNPRADQDQQGQGSTDSDNAGNTNAKGKGGGQGAGKGKGASNSQGTGNGDG